MKLFLLFIVSILFVACSSDDPTTPTNQSQTPGTTDISDVQTIPVPTEDLDDPELANVSADEIDPIAKESVQTPENEQGLISLEDLAIVPPTTPALTEEITSLEEPLKTEDQLLIYNIENRYSDYINLQNTWETELPHMEELIDQATSRKFLRPILYIQFNIEKVPVTDFQIEEMKEKLSNAGAFVYSEDREDAKDAYKLLDQYVITLHQAIKLSLSYAELAEQNPDIMYAQTTEDEPETPETPPAIAETSTTTTQPDASEEPATDDDDTNVIEKLYDELIASITSESEATTEPAADTTASTEPAPVVVATESNEVDMTADEEETKDDTPSTEVDMTADEEETENDTPSTEVDMTADEEETEDDTETLEPTTTDEMLAETNADLEEVDETTTEAEEDITTEESADVDLTEAEPWTWDWVVENASAVWDSIAEPFTPNPEYIIEPTTLHIPNTNTIVPEEEDPENSEQAEAHQLIDQLLQNVQQLAEYYKVSSVEELTVHLEEASSLPETERTVEQTTLFNTTSQITQRINQMEDTSVADFIEFSGYSSETLLSEEIVMIIETLSQFADTSEEDQEQVL